DRTPSRGCEVAQIARVRAAGQRQRRRQAAARQQRRRACAGMWSRIRWEAWEGTRTRSQPAAENESIMKSIRICDRRKLSCCGGNLSNDNSATSALLLREQCLVFKVRFECRLQLQGARQLVEIGAFHEAVALCH